LKFKAAEYNEPTNPVGRVAELFAGVGGFRIGLSRANLQTVFSNQWEPSTKVQHASDVYVARFGSAGHINQDIGTVSEITGEFDVLVGGFPCQDYSVAKASSSATGLEGKKGVLWWEILRLVMLHQPKFVFLENVDRLLKSPSKQRGRDFAVMLTTLGNAGYVVEWRVVNAADYGLPQKRVRVFIVATRKDCIRITSVDSESTFRSGVLINAFPITEESRPLPVFNLSADASAVSDKFTSPPGSYPFGNAGFFSDGLVAPWKAHAAWAGPRFTLGDVLVEDQEIPEEFWIKGERLAEWEFLKGAKSIARTHRDSGFTYQYSEGAISFPDPTDRASRTILTGEGGTTPSRFKHVVSRPQGLRRLVPVELERLCGFPDNWTNPPELKPLTDARRAFFMGNALVVGLVEMVARELANRLKDLGTEN
jgi:DNA (cytosine-5)-methyltransferase 1